MGEAKAVGQGPFEAAAGGVAVGAGLDEDVGGERRETARDRPDVEVMHLDDAALVDERLPDRLGVDVVRCALEEDHGRLAQELRARPQHETGDEEARHRVEPIPAGGEDDPAGERRPREGRWVGDDVEERAAHVEALPTGAREHQAGHDVDEAAGQSDDEDQPAAHLARVDQAVDGRPDDPDREEAERQPVYLRGEDLEPRVAVRPAPGCRARGHAGGEQREAERGGVGEHVAGVGKQRERVRGKAGDDLADHDPGDEDERDRDRAAVGRQPVVVMVVGHRREPSSASRSRACAP